MYLLVNKAMPSQDLFDLFGYETFEELAQDENLPAYYPPETDRAGLLY